MKIIGTIFVVFGALAFGFIWISVVPFIAGWLAVKNWSLRLEIKRTWGSSGKYVIIDYPESQFPDWKTIIETKWIPRFKAQTILLDANSQDTWQQDPLPLAARVYRHLGPDHKFIRPPVIILVFPNAKTQTISFNKAMHELKKGNAIILNELLSKLENLIKTP